MVKHEEVAKLCRDILVGRRITLGYEESEVLLATAYLIQTDRLRKAEAVCLAADSAFTLVDNIYPYIQPDRADKSVAFGKALAAWRTASPTTLGGDEG